MFLFWEPQSWMEYCKWDRTRVELRGMIASSDLRAVILLVQPYDWLAFWSENTHCQLMMSFSSITTPQFHMAALNAFSCQPVLMSEVATTQCSTLHLALLNRIHLMWDHFLCLSKSLWMTSLPFVKSTASLSLFSSKTYSIPLSKSFSKILSSAGPSKDCWGTVVKIQTPFLCPITLIL